LIERLQDEYERLDNKSKFIELVIEKKLVYVNRNEQDIIRDFEKHGLKRIYPKKDAKHDILAQEDADQEEYSTDEQIPSNGDSGYDYLFEINVRGFTRQKVRVHTGKYYCVSKYVLTCKLAGKPSKSAYEEDGGDSGLP
jgi:DNA topoisomerase-2